MTHWVPRSHSVVLLNFHRNIQERYLKLGHVTTTSCQFTIHCLPFIRHRVVWLINVVVKHKLLRFRFEKKLQWSKTKTKTKLCVTQDSIHLSHLSVRLRTSVYLFSTSLHFFAYSLIRSESSSISLQSLLLLVNVHWIVTLSDSYWLLLAAGLTCLCY